MANYGFGRLIFQILICSCLSFISIAFFTRTPNHQPYLSQVSLEAISYRAQQSDFEKYGEYAESFYDGDAIERLYNRNPLKVVERLVDVGIPLGWWYLTTRWDNATWQTPIYTETQQEYFKSIRGRQLREALVDTNSVTFIKSGQALSLRPDLVKIPQYVDELTKLQDEVGTFPNDQAMKIIEEDLGAPPKEIFDFIEEYPVASASIGQVYKCRIRATNQTVAVKVQRPDAFRSAALDMFILRNFARFFKKWKNLRSDMIGIADEFGKQLFGELNYEQEARNCLRFKQLYGNIEGIYVPDVFFEYTSRRVLTMEWIEGEKGPWDEGGERMLAIGLQCSVLQILDSGFFHADPHRGNLLKTPEGNLAYLDFGMMANVSDTNRFGLIATSLGLQYKDIDLITRNLVTLGFLPDNTQVDILIPALQKAFVDASGGSGSNLNFTQFNSNIQDISYLLDFRIPPFYSLIVRTLTILEGLAKGVDPDFKLIRGAYPFIAKQILTTNSEEFKKLVERVLITEDNRIEWTRLEQLLSISSATNSGEFADLKRAQERSDLQRKYVKAEGQEEEAAEVTLELAGQVLEFLGSENGQFLREPLVNEVVETVDSLGIAGLNLVSVASQGFVPKAQYNPDRQRVEVIGKLLVQVVNRASGVPVQSAVSANGVPPGGNRAAPPSLPQLQKATQDALNYIQNPANQKTIEPLLKQSQSLVTEVFARLLERNLIRATSTAIDFIVNPTTLNPLSQVVDALLPSISNPPKKSQK